MAELMVGIDFGTSNSAVVLYEGSSREPNIFPIDKVEPYNLLRSVVGYKKDELQPVIGETVRKNASYYDDVIESVKLEMSKGKQKAYTLTTGEQKSPIEVAAEIFKYMKGRIEEDYGDEAVIQKVAITVPAIFDEPTRLNILEAARQGGLDVYSAEENLIDEPTAASESFDAFGELNEGNQYLIFDFGAGTLDLSYFEKKTARFEQIAKGGRRIGGNDFDKVMLNWFLERCKHELKVDLKDEKAGAEFFGDQTSYELSLIEIHDKCRATKEALSKAESAAVSMRLLPGKIINYKITRKEFESLVTDKIRLVRQECENLWHEVHSRIEHPKLERVYLVGGASLMPFVEQVIQEVFEKKPWRPVGDLQGPKFCVAAGAAKFARTGIAAKVDISAPLKGMTRLTDHIYLRVGHRGEETRVIGLLKEARLPAKSELDYVFKLADGVKSFELNFDFAHKALKPVKFTPPVEGRSLFLIQLEATTGGLLRVHARQHNGPWKDTQETYL